MLNRLQRGQFLSVHQGESVADVLGATGSSDAMDVILRMLWDIIIDDMTDAGDIEPARGDIGRDHHFVFAALKSSSAPIRSRCVRFECKTATEWFPCFNLCAMRSAPCLVREKKSALSKLVRSSSNMSRSNFCSAATG